MTVNAQCTKLANINESTVYQSGQACIVLQITLCRLHKSVLCLLHMVDMVMSHRIPVCDTSELHSHFCNQLGLPQDHGPDIQTFCCPCDHDVQPQGTHCTLCASQADICSLQESSAHCYAQFGRQHRERCDPLLFYQTRNLKQRRNIISCVVCFPLMFCAWWVISI